MGANSRLGAYSNKYGILPGAEDDEILLLLTTPMGLSLMSGRKHDAYGLFSTECLFSRGSA